MRRLLLWKENDHAMPAFRGYKENGTFEGDPVVLRRRAKSLEKVRCITDEEKHVASKTPVAWVDSVPSADPQFVAWI